MPNGFLLSRVLLKFDSADDNLAGELSAITRTPDGSLWVGSDEYLTIERLSPIEPCIYGNHTKFHVNDFVTLFDTEDEIDIEGMDYADGYLWLVGSHSTKRKNIKGKDPQQDIQRLAKIKQESNRYLLARIPIVDGEPVKSYNQSEAAITLSAAALQRTQSQNSLMELLNQDEHLGPFLQVGLPSKDNGFDIEGLAVVNHRVFLGLRGPVLRGWAVILEIELEQAEPDVLKLKDLGGAFYRKHFVNLNGLGVRELCLYQQDLIILAGPTMELEGAMQVFQLKNVLSHSNDTIWDQTSDALNLLFDLPLTLGTDHAEGLTLFPCLGYEDGLMVVYDSPDQQRRPDDRSIFADVFRLPLISVA